MTKMTPEQERAYWLRYWEVVRKAFWAFDWKIEVPKIN